MPLAPTAVSLLLAYRASKEVLAKNVLSTLLNTLCRHAPPTLYVSRAAQAEANRRGLGSLLEFGWNDQVRRMRDDGRKVFAWDHYWPVAELRGALDDLPEPTERRVRKILRRASIAWILRTEDQELNRLGYRFRRPDPAAAYRAAGIKLM